MSPQTDGMTLWEPRGEIYLQIIQQKWREGEGERVGTGGRESRYKWQREQEGGGQREKQGLSQVVHSAKQVFDKHTESKQSQSTVTVTRSAWPI